MQNRVRLKKGALNYFRKLARKSTNEVQAYLVGEVVDENLIEVEEFAYTKQYATSTPSEVSWFTKDYETVQKRAEERGKRIVGFIHSHPQWDAVCSPFDYKLCITDMHRLCGICSVDNHGTSRVRFWVMDSALPCEIVYAENKRAQSGVVEDSKR